MGRDDARPVAGLYGGTAPARAFHDFMSVAVASRPVEQFETQVPMPDWQLSPEEEIYDNEAVDANHMPPMVDENGMPIGAPATEPGFPQQQPMVQPDGTGQPTQQQLDQAFPPQQPRPAPNQYQQQPRQPVYPPTRQPQPQPRPAPGSAVPPDAPQSRPYAA